MLETRAAALRTRPLGPGSVTEVRHDEATIRLLPAATRFSLRMKARGRALPVLAGLRLDQGINRAASQAERSSLRIGPDEWILTGPEADADLIQADTEQAVADIVHALVDVSHRDVSFEISGCLAEVALNAGCPLDLDARVFPPGSVTRTLLGKAEIILWRKSESPSFEVTCWRSFATYVHGFLIEAAHGLG